MVDQAIADLASTQCLLFSRAQAVALGASDDLIGRRLSAKRWEGAAPGVYSLPGWRMSWHRRLWLAHLDVGPDSVVSHEAAAALHECTTFKPGPVILTVSHGNHHRPADYVVRQSTDIRPEHCTLVDGLPVTTVARTFVDLAAVVRSRARYELALDDAYLAGKLDMAALASLYVEIRRPRKKGMRLLGAVLAERGDGYVPPESVLERRLLRVLDKGGLPKPERQHPLPWRPEAEGRVDLCYPKQRVILEADGRRWHARMASFDADRERDHAALNHGWRIYRFTWFHITKRPLYVCEVVRDALTLAA